MLTLRRILLLVFAVAVFAVLFAPIPTIDIAVDMPAPPSPERIRIDRGILGAVVGIIFVLVYFGLRRRRPPSE